MHSGEQKCRIAPRPPKVLYLGVRFSALSSWFAMACELGYNSPMLFPGAGVPFDAQPGTGQPR
jgi:hypothetical protein